MKLIFSCKVNLLIFCVVDQKTTYTRPLQPNSQASWRITCNDMGMFFGIKKLDTTTKQKWMRHSTSFAFRIEMNTYVYNLYV